jgi:hypothetical protein
MPRDDERLAEARVEALRHVAHELEVLALVLADRHLVGPVGEHVGGLEHGIEEQAGRDELAVERLVAELVHPVELTQGGDRAQQPAELAVLGTSPWRKSRQRSGSSPAASSSAAVSYVTARSSAGS